MKSYGVMSNLPVILIIEDDHMLGSTYVDILTMNDYAPMLIGDGRKALEYLEHNVPDIILVDYNLPQVNGIEIINFIREDERFLQTRIALLTADKSIKQSGADFILYKPFGFDEIIDVVEKCVS